MAKKKKQAQKPSRSTASDTPKNEAAAKDGKANKKADRKRGDGLRETFESIVVAFILAFLFRSFEAEAFVIPTGSRAPTLYGRHKDVTCEQCGYHFAVGASDEVESPGYLIPGRRVNEAICPNCRYVTPKQVVRNLPVFKGDRILVNKFPYEFGDPQRWDVVVFKYPEEPQTNYIKRLVGLPGDQLEIRQGDVYNNTDDGLKILRKKDPDKQKRLQILVYDADHPPKKLLEAGWPRRWAALRKTGTGRDAWQPDDGGWVHEDTEDGQAYTLDSAAAGEGELRWIRYRHLVPGNEDWKFVLDGGEFNGENPRRPLPRLITDFCGYNAYLGGQYKNCVDYGQYWVGDLTVRCDVAVDELEDDPELTLELIEGFRTYRCRFDLESGQCTILHLSDGPREEEDEVILGTAETELQGAGKHRVTFANVDDRLCVWVDGDLVDFGTDESGESKSVYAPFGSPASYQQPTNADLAPVGIAARGCSVTVSGLLLQRDIYYRAERVAPESEFDRRPRSVHEYVGEPASNDDCSTFTRLNSLQHDPVRWWKQFSGEQQGPNGTTVFPNLNPAKFPRLGEDEYFMMGDNSPRSRDSRLWPNYHRRAKHRFAVPRSALVGKAFYTYWPHGIPFMNDGKGYPLFHHKTITGERSDYPSFRIPFYPNFKRMKRIR